MVDKADDLMEQWIVGRCTQSISAMHEWIDEFVQWVQDGPYENARQANVLLFALYHSELGAFDDLYRCLSVKLAPLCNEQREAKMREDIQEDAKRLIALDDEKLEC